MTAVVSGSFQAQIPFRERESVPVGLFQQWLVVGRVGQRSRWVGGGFLSFLGLLPFQRLVSGAVRTPSAAFGAPLHRWECERGAGSRPNSPAQWQGRQRK